MQASCLIEVTFFTASKVIMVWSFYLFIIVHCIYYNSVFLSVLNEKLLDTVASTLLTC